MEKDCNVLVDSSGDRRYFTIVPQVVWALCRNVYDFSLWHVVKMIAGEDGECFLSTEDLSRLAMMSVGSVSRCRGYLLAAGLLTGELRRDPGYPQPVWHLSVPNLWRLNLEWRDSIGNKLKDRIRMKEAQKKSLRKDSESLPHGKASPQEGEPSRGETPPSTGEGCPSPVETKDNQQGQPDENQGGRSTTTGRRSSLRVSPEDECLTITNLGDGGEAAVQALRVTGVPGTSKRGRGARDAVLAAIAGGWSEAEVLVAVEGWLAYAASERGATIQHAGFFTAAQIRNGVRPPSEAAVPESLSRDEKAWVYVEQVMAERGLRT